VINGVDQSYRNYLTDTWAKYLLCSGVMFMPYGVQTQICSYLTDDLSFDQVLPFIVGTAAGKNASALKPGLPYFFDPTLVRKSFAVMVAKAWYNNVHVILHTISDLGPVLYKDPFCMGLQPWARFRRLTIHMDVDELVKSAGGSLVPDSVRAPFQNLCKIRLKNDFRLTVELHQQPVKLDELFAIYSAFQPIKKHFEKKGAVVAIQMSPTSGSMKLPLGPRSD
jgi:hypothetical protein